MSITMILTQDIVASIIDGNSDMMAWLRDQAQDNKIILLLSCVIEGLERACHPTNEGVRDLAELISICCLRVMPEQTGDLSEHAIPILLTPDVLLACLLGIIDSSIIAQMAEELTVLITDAILVGALLSIEDKDDIHPNNLAATLKFTSMRLIKPETTDRARWRQRLSAGTVAKIRTKALCQPTRRRLARGVL